MRRSTAAGLAATVTAAMLLAGCGGSDDDNDDDNAEDSSSLTGDAFAEQDPQAIVDAAEEATKGASSLRFSGSTADETTGAESKVDIAVDRDGNCSGTITNGPGTAEILGAGGQYWFKPDEAFWQAAAGAQAPQIIELVGDKYVVNSSLGEVCDLDQLFEDSDDDDEQTYTQEGTDTVDGQEVVKIGKDDEEDGPSTAYILVDEPHYLVQVDNADGTSASVTDFDEPVEVEAPAEDQQIDLENAGG